MTPAIYSVNIQARFRDFMALQWLALTRVRQTQWWYLKTLLWLAVSFYVLPPLLITCIEFKTLLRAHDPIYTFFNEWEEYFAYLFANPILPLSVILLVYVGVIIVTTIANWRAYAHGSRNKHYSLGNDGLTFQFYEGLSTHSAWSQVVGVFETPGYLFLHVKYTHSAFYILPRCDFESEQQYNDVKRFIESRIKG